METQSNTEGQTKADIHSREIEFWWNLRHIDIPSVRTAQNIVVPLLKLQKNLFNLFKGLHHSKQSPLSPLQVTYYYTFQEKFSCRVN